MKRESQSTGRKIHRSGAGREKKNGVHMWRGPDDVASKLVIHMWGRGIAPVPMGSHRRQSYGFSPSRDPLTVRDRVLTYVSTSLDLGSSYLGRGNAPSPHVVTGFETTSDGPRHKIPRGPRVYPPDFFSL